MVAPNGTDSPHGTEREDCPTTEGADAATAGVREYRTFGMALPASWCERLDTCAAGGVRQRPGRVHTQSQLQEDVGLSVKHKRTILTVLAAAADLTTTGAAWYTTLDTPAGDGPPVTAHGRAGAGDLRRGPPGPR